jgi:hypothetical protein
MSEVGTRDITLLNWDVLVSPGIPMATTDLPPGMKQAMFKAIASTLIYDKRDVVLVDAIDRDGSRCHIDKQTLKIL